MRWPTQAWWKRAFREIDERVFAQVRVGQAAADRQRATREQAERSAEIEARLRSHEIVVSDIAREGWHRGGGRGVRRIERGDGGAWFVVDD